MWRVTPPPMDPPLGDSSTAHMEPTYPSPDIFSNVMVILSFDILAEDDSNAIAIVNSILASSTGYYNGPPYGDPDRTHPITPFCDSYAIFVKGESTTISDGYVTP